MVCNKAVAGKSSDGRGGRGRRPVPDMDEEHLMDLLVAYVNHVGIRCAFEFHAYKGLQVANAVHGPSLLKLDGLARALLQAAPSCEIKYSALKSCLKCCSSFLIYWRPVIMLGVGLRAQLVSWLVASFARCISCAVLLEIRESG